MSMIGKFATAIRRGVARSILSSSDRAFLPFGPNGSAASFEGAGYGRRLKNFQPAQQHINAAMMSAGRTLIKRARFLVENNAYAGNGVDVWTQWVIGDGIRPHIKSEQHRQAWKMWVKEADAEGLTNFYGLQEKAERECFTAGEVFLRQRFRKPGDMKGPIKFQLQLLQAEMLDFAFNVRLPNGNVVRMGVEFDMIGRRVAYHFWRQHPDDFHMMMPPGGNTRVRVPAEQVIHLIDARQGGQIRGVSRMARVIVKLFMYDGYDDGELDRKRTAALLTAFITKTGEQNPLDDEDPDDEVSEYDEEELVAMAPGATVALKTGESVTISQPAESGASYEPFQYRTSLQIAVGLGVPYAYLTGDTTKGNFSNVRTEIVNFRRRILARQSNAIVPQLCNPVMDWFENSYTHSPDTDRKPMDELEWIAPKMDWVDPLKDVKADVLAIRGGLRSRSRVVAEGGMTIEEVDAEIVKDMKFADDNGMILDTDPRYVSQAGMSNAMPPGSGYGAPGDEIMDPADNNDNSELSDYQGA